MSMTQSKAAVLWTGGKDSCLAFYEAQKLGYEVESLITFVPGNAEFRAHPVSIMKLQAEAMELPHYTIEIREPYKKSYEEAISILKEDHGINTLFTGDIAEFDGQTNWIRACSEYSGVNVLTPLWGVDRRKNIENLLFRKFKIIFSCVKKPWFTEDWLGKEINEDMLAQLTELNREYGVDICGENGENHTLVTDGPVFKKLIKIDNYVKRTDGNLMYIDIKKTFLYEE